MEPIDALVQAVLDSPKYRAVSPELVRALGLRELAARRNLKAAIKETKNRLHQAAGAYFDARPDYAAWLAELAAAADGQHAAPFRHPSFSAACRRIMARHASTRERLPILETFFATTLAGLPPIRSALDVACGLNPLALPWMPLAPGATYFACDIYADLADFLRGFFALAGVAGEAEVCDLLAGPPARRADLALALKVLPVLEQLSRGAGLRLLRALNAPFVLV